MGAKLRIEPGRCETHARARVLDDVGKLTPVQLGIRRHGSKACVPDAVNGFEIFDAVLGDDRDAVTGPEPHPLQRAREPRRAPGQFAIALRRARSLADRRQAGMA